jgi:hypothetical protein
VFVILVLFVVVFIVIDVTTAGTGASGRSSTRHIIGRRGSTSAASVLQLGTVIFVAAEAGTPSWAVVHGFLFRMQHTVSNSLQQVSASVQWLTSDECGVDGDAEAEKLRRFMCLYDSIKQLHVLGL